MKARLVARSKEVLDDGSTVEVVVWEVPAPVPPSRHRYKCRLYYGAAGQSRVRYDNERGKGDHRHIGAQEELYAFTSIDFLLDDFERDIADWGAA